MSIRQLPVELANQIAAGEVVERPASVVKELIENSLDAGATEIVIDIEAGGRKRIRVRDNGSGIAKDELALALARHATSKISTLDDLEAIYSLGFRGEALASMSSVSRLVLTSKPAAQQQAWQAWTNGRDMQAQIEPAAHPDGTTIDISDLFFNTPARRKFLRTDKTEFGHIDEMVKRIALSRFDVSFQLRHNQQLVRQLPIANTPKQRQQRLAKLCGSLFAEQAQRISVESQGYHLEGWFAPSAGCRHQPDVQYFFVNGRMMRDKLLAHALRQAYEPWLIDEKVPTYVLFLRLPAEQVDVNVHPAKHEVRFHQARQVHDWLLQQVRHGLQAVEQDPSAALVTEAGHHYHSHDNDALPATADIPKPRSPLLPNAAPSRPASQGDWRQLVPQQERQQADHRWQVLRVIQQRFALLIDQQEQLAYLDLWPLYRDSQAHKLRRSVDHGLAGQPLLVPVKLNVELAREFTAIDRLAMERLGIHARQEGRSVVISHVPQMLRRSDVPAMIADLVKQWQRLSNDPEQLCQWLLKRQPPLTMSTTEAEQLVIEWQQQGAPQQWLQPLATPEVTDAAH